MENENNQQPQNNPEQPRDSNNGVNQTTPPSQAPIPQPPTIQPAPATAVDNAPKMRVWNYIGAVFGLLIVMAMFLPASSFTENLGWPIGILGVVAGLTFMWSAIIESRKTNKLVQPFVILGGIGMGVVIFIICLVIAVIVGLSKNPHPQSTG